MEDTLFPHASTNVHVFPPYSKLVRAYRLDCLRFSPTNALRSFLNPDIGLIIQSRMLQRLGIQYCSTRTECYYVFCLFSCCLSIKYARYFRLIHDINVFDLIARHDARPCPESSSCVGARIRALRSVVLGSEWYYVFCLFSCCLSIK